MDSQALRVYWRPGCSSCVKVKEFLSQLGVDYQSINVSATPEAMDELREMGVRTVPVVARGREYVFAQALEDVSRFLGKDVQMKRLPPEAYKVMRDEGTERAGTSPLDHEKRPGVFVCAGCGLPVFTSEMKFDSGTGWPSFFTSIPGAFEMKKDFYLIYPRTEYHCMRCGGHHGHLFDDGPAPTNQRWCNNGVSLRFIPK